MTKVKEKLLTTGTTKVTKNSYSQYLAFKLFFFSCSFIFSSTDSIVGAFHHSSLLKFELDELLLNESQSTTLVSLKNRTKELDLIRSWIDIWNLKG